MSTEMSTEIEMSTRMSTVMSTVSTEIGMSTMMSTVMREMIHQSCPLELGQEAKVLTLCWLSINPPANFDQFCVDEISPEIPPQIGLYLGGPVNRQ
jgi:hypothetical protein